MILFFIFLITLQKIICSENDEWLLPNHYNILLNEKEGLSRDYVNLLMYLLKTSQRIYNNLSNANFNESLRQCNSTINDLFEKDKDFLYSLYLSSIINPQFSRDLSTFPLCDALNKNNQNRSKYINFQLNYSLENLNLNMSLCIPDNCSSLAKEIFFLSQNKSNRPILKFYIFPLDNQSTHSDDWLINFGYIFLCYIGVWIILNLIFTFCHPNNPHKIRSENVIERPEFMVPDTKINNYNELAKKDNFLVNIYNTYFSVYNISYVILSTETKIVNAKKLRFLYGLTVVGLILHMSSCAFLVIYRVLLNMNGLSDLNEYDNLLFGCLFGTLFIEFYMTILGFIFIFKIFHFIKKYESFNRNKLFFIFIFKQIDKFFVFFLINLMVIQFINKKMFLNRRSNVMSFFEQYKFTDCGITSIIPSFFYNYTSRKRDNCFNGHSYFYEIFYTILTGSIITRFLISLKSKFLYLIITFLISYILRVVYVICFFLYIDPHPNQNMNYLILSYSSVSQNYFLFHLPNFILGLIGGHIFYNNQTRLREEKEDVPIINGLEKLENILQNKLFKNISFWISLIILIFFSSLQSILFKALDMFNNNVTYLIFISSSLGLIGSICLFFIIMTVKLKINENWGITKLAIYLMKYILCNELVLMISRLTLITLIIHKAITLFLIFNLDSDYVYFDIYSTFNVYGIPLVIIILIISLVLALTIHFPLIIFIKKFFKNESN